VKFQLGRQVSQSKIASSGRKAKSEKGEISSCQLEIETALYFCDRAYETGSNLPVKIQSNWIQDGKKMN